MLTLSLPCFLWSPTLVQNTTLSRWMRTFFFLESPKQQQQPKTLSHSLSHCHSACVLIVTGSFHSPSGCHLMLLHSVPHRLHTVLTLFFSTIIVNIGFSERRGTLSYLADAVLHSNNKNCKANIDTADNGRKQIKGNIQIHFQLKQKHQLLKCWLGNLKDAPVYLVLWHKARLRLKMTFGKFLLNVSKQQGSLLGTLLSSLQRWSGQTSGQIFWIYSFIHVFIFPRWNSFLHAQWPFVLCWFSTCAPVSSSASTDSVLVVPGLICTFRLQTLCSFKRRKMSLSLGTLKTVG